MSTRGVSTGTPTASMALTSSPTRFEHEVEIMDHQVEHDIDVEAALGKRAQSVNFDESGLPNQRPHPFHRRIEALRVTDRQDDPAAPGQLEQPIGIRRRRRHRLFDQHVHAALEERLGDLEMRLRRRRNRHRIDRIENLAPVGERASCAARSAISRAARSR